MVGEQSAGRLIFWCGAAIPSLLLFLLLAYALWLMPGLRPFAEAGEPAALRIEVTGEQWWWRVRYLTADMHDFALANELRIPAGRTVELQLKSADVIHSFWVPELQGKMDLTPGREDAMVIEADRPGTYRGQCAEYCGLQHARMAMLVIAEEQADFDAWVTGQQQPALEPVPREAALLLGREVFMSSSCVYCHAIRGTPARGTLGPDLTHLASRQTLVAGQVPNTRGNLAGWITDPQSIKPGNLMPATFLEGERLQALLDYLESLE